MTDKELKKFIINFIEEKEKENENYIRYTYYELKVKRGLTEDQIDEVLRVSRDYFENKGYNVYFTNAEFEYQNAKRRFPSVLRKPLSASVTFLEATAPVKLPT